jgi:nifR3 family TIM-barrel protein
MKFIKKLKIRNIEFKNNLALAPLAGITLKPFRENLVEMGAGIVFTEMISSYGILYDNKKTLKMLDVQNEKMPVIVQIFGNDENIMADAAKKLQDFGAKIIDINMGCPTTKVVNSGSGSALLKDTKKVQNIIHKIRKAIDIPLTLKIRAGWDLESINAVEISKIAEGEGIELISVHSRTRSQKFNEFDWTIIAKVKETIKIPVIGNGNIFCPEDVKRMFEKTFCDGFMIGRASFSNPWIFKQILDYEKNGEYKKVTDAEKLDYILKFSRDFIVYTGDEGIFALRKFIVWLTKGLPNSKFLRDDFFAIKNLNDINEIILKYKEVKVRNFGQI